jgi:hypothetical protein
MMAVPDESKTNKQTKLMIEKSMVGMKSQQLKAKMSRI